MIKIAPLLRELYTVADGGETEEKKFDFQNTIKNVSIIIVTLWYNNGEAAFRMQ